MIVTYLDTLCTLEYFLRLYKTGLQEANIFVDPSMRVRYASLLAIYRHLRDCPDQPYHGRVIPDKELEGMFATVPVRGEGTFNDSTL